MQTKGSEWTTTQAQLALEYAKQKVGIPTTFRNVSWDEIDSEFRSQMIIDYGSIGGDDSKLDNYSEWYKSVLEHPAFLSFHSDYVPLYKFIKVNTTEDYERRKKLRQLTLEYINGGGTVCAETQFRGFQTPPELLKLQSKK